MSTDITKEFAQVETAVQLKGVAGSVMRQVVNPPFRNEILPAHYQGKVQEFMMYAFEEMDPPQIILPPAIKAEFRELAEAVEAILQAQYNKPLTLAGLAQRLATNITYVQRAFKEHYNISVMQRLMYIRIEKVKELLLDTTDDLETIATQAQFHDAAHLINKFKSITGQTPTQFRDYWLN